MIIRKANITDDFITISNLIYNTDQYIYPYFFKNTPNWQEYLTQMIKTKGTIFYYENILLSIIDDEIAGIIISFDENTYLSQDYSKWIDINKNFHFTIKKYILPTISHKLENSIYISNVCVDKKFRGKGVSKNLFSYLYNNYPNKNFELDVLEENSIALNLYKSQGFEIVSKIKGFNAPYKRKPLVYCMKKYLK